MAALLMSANSTASVQQIRDGILQSADIVPGLVGYTTTGGRINAARAFDAIGGMVAPPTMTPTPAPTSDPPAVSNESLFLAAVKRTATRVNLGLLVYKTDTQEAISGQIINLDCSKRLKATRISDADGYAGFRVARQMSNYSCYAHSASTKVKSNSVRIRR